MNNYTCPSCEGTSTEEDWNNETENWFGEGIAKIGTEYSKIPNPVYICPICLTENGYEDIVNEGEQP